MTVFQSAEKNVARTLANLGTGSTVCARFSLQAVYQVYALPYDSVISHL